MRIIYDKRFCYCINCYSTLKTYRLCSIRSKDFQWCWCRSRPLQSRAGDAEEDVDVPGPPGLCKNKYQCVSHVWNAIRFTSTPNFISNVLHWEKSVSTLFDWHFKQYANYWLQYSFWLVRVVFMCGEMRGALGVWHLWDVCQWCKGGCKAVEQKKQLNMLISVYFLKTLVEMDINKRFMCSLVKACKVIQQPNSRPNSRVYCT